MNLKNNHSVACTICPRECLLEEGQRGFCFVRQNIHGHVVLSSGNRISSLCVDPIEKKPLYHFLPGSRVLSLGTMGCNMACRFCQNAHISQTRDFHMLTRTVSPDQIVRIAQEQGCSAVAFTYNEPIIFIELVMDIARECQRHGIKTVAVTNGYLHPQARNDFFKYIDALNIDLKSFCDEFYQKFCLAHLQPVLDSMCDAYHRQHKWLEITNLILPHENDSDEEIEAMCRWIVQNLSPSVPVHFNAFFPQHHMTGGDSTSPEALHRAHQIAQQVGLQYVYLGNIEDQTSSTTFCACCGKPVIERGVHSIKKYNLIKNACRYCGAEIPGYFKDPVNHDGSLRFL